MAHTSTGKIIFKCADSLFKAECKLGKWQYTLNNYQFLFPAKLVPLAYGIHKLQISCVVEDEKVSVDWLQETIQEIEDYVSSFNWTY